MQHTSSPPYQNINTLAITMVCQTFMSQMLCMLYLHYVVYIVIIIKSIICQDAVMVIIAIEWLCLY